MPRGGAASPTNAARDDQALDQEPGDRDSRRQQQLGVVADLAASARRVKPADIVELVIAAAGSPPSERASKPSISEAGNGHGWEVTNSGSRATIPDSSSTSRRTASSADSPGEMKPASVE